MQWKHVARGEGRTVTVIGGDRITFKASSAETGGAYRVRSYSVEDEYEHEHEHDVEHEHEHEHDYDYGDAWG